jgi:hypothetical protein
LCCYFVDFVLICLCLSRRCYLCVSRQRHESLQAIHLRCLECGIEACDR